MISSPALLRVPVQDYAGQLGLAASLWLFSTVDFPPFNLSQKGNFGNCRIIHLSSIQICRIHFFEYRIKRMNFCNVHNHDHPSRTYIQSPILFHIIAPIGAHFLRSTIDKSQVMVGGTNQNSDLTRFRSKTPDILVATPGRLNDNLKTDRNMTAAMGGLRTLVFDEADRLLDMGFRCSSRPRP